MENINTGYVACDYGAGDQLIDVEHGPIRATPEEALADARTAAKHRSGDAYQGVRWVAADGYLYVDKPED